MTEQLLSIIIHIINAVILFVILRFLVYKPMRRFMQAREQRIADALEEAAAAQAQAERQRLENEAIAAEAQQTARENALEITQAANTAAQTMTDAARKEAAAIVARAKAAAQAEHDKAMEGLQGEVVDLAAEMAAQILRNKASGGDPIG